MCGGKTRYLCWDQCAVALNSQWVATPAKLATVQITLVVKGLAKYVRAHAFA